MTFAFARAISVRRRIEMLALGRNRYRILLFGWIALAVTATTLALEPVRAQQDKSELDREAKITATKPQLKAFTLVQPFVGHIQAQRDVKVRALGRGRLAEIAVKEGQHVKEGDVLFKTIIPTPTPFRTNGQWVWIIPVGFQTKGQPTRAGSKFDIYKAPFDGTVGRLQHKPGSMVEEGEILTTLSDDSVMQVYFKVTKEQCRGRAHAVSRPTAS
jgi:membrane fusion protein (multidrug efflux system)